VLARTPPIDLWPVLAALITQFAPSFSPQAVDARKLGEAKARIAAAAPTEVDNELVSLALEVSASIGNRASQLSTALYQWGNRTALLSVGDPSAALRAVALATTGNQGPPPNGPDRIKWIVRNAEARDLAIFSVSEGYSEARRRLGLRA
ncbi:MAG TPA: hypothetical protein VFQ61_08650, partial [Polyangiaceae bacterium]|nr:hypothetical protein [Polyangiaceae bacterium]